MSHCWGIRLPHGLRIREQATARTQCELVGINDCKCRDHQLNVSSEGLCINNILISPMLLFTGADSGLKFLGNKYYLIFTKSKTAILKINKERNNVVSSDSTKNSQMQTYFCR
jgi:hypothetical protein